MRKILFLVGTLFWLNPEQGISQISILPEIGISYLPFTHYGANTETESNRIDGLFGLSAQLEIQEKYSINTRFSYVNRETIRWTDQTFDPRFLYAEVKHSDLNLDFTFMLNMDIISIGLGPIYTRKFTEYANVYRMPSQTSIHSGVGNRFGVNARMSITIINNLYLNISYIRYIVRPSRYYAYAGYNRLDVTVSYRLLGGKKEKKR